MFRMGLNFPNNKWRYGRSGVVAIYLNNSKGECMRNAVLILLSCLLFSPNLVGAVVVYGPDQVERELKEIERGDGIETVSIGRSEKGLPIQAIKLGRGKRSVLLVGAHHGREWLSSLLLMRMLKEYSVAYQDKELIGGVSSRWLDEVSIWFIPMLNPDGVSIQQGDLSRLSLFEKAAVFKMNHFSNDWSRWKANAKGIDLNRQYPAGWGEPINQAEAPSYQFYKGERPLQAVEAKALVAFTRKIDPLIAVSYHTSGREIFWHYRTRHEHVARDYGIAKNISELTGYALTMPEKEARGSGFTDWFITEFQRPAMTLELSYLVDETNPPLSVFPAEWERNRLVGMALIKEVLQMNIH